MILKKLALHTKDLFKLAFSALRFQLFHTERSRSVSFSFKLAVFSFQLLAFSFPLLAQVQLDRQVIGSAGHEGSSASLKLSSTVGETAVNTQAATSFLITEGFQQPLQIQGLIAYTINVENASCIGRSNGFAEIISPTGCVAPYNIFWSNGQSGSRATNLAPGNYTVQLISDDGCESQIQSFTIETISGSPCLLKFYSGITPNEDGINDSWVIDNIEAFPNNEVIIYDRNGNKVFEGKNYDNANVVWEGNNLSGGPLPSDTYFYIFSADGVSEKGWIELTR